MVLKTSNRITWYSVHLEANCVIKCEKWPSTQQQVLNNVHMLFTTLPNIGNTCIPIHSPETPQGSQGELLSG